MLVSKWFKRPVLNSDRKKMKHTVVCPHCQAKIFYNFNTSNSNYDINCSYCKNSFLTRIVKIRAKRSRGDRESGSRNFTIRIIEFSGKEDLIEFRNPRYKDFELRQGDLAVFSFEENYLRIVQNLTIDKVYYVKDFLITKIFRFFKK